MTNLKIQLATEVTKLGETEKMLSSVKLILNKTENEKQEQVRFASCPQALSFCSYLVSQAWNLVESNCSATSKHS